MVKNEDVILSFLADENNKAGTLECKDGQLKLYNSIIATKEKEANNIKIFKVYSSKTTTLIMNMLPNVKINWKNGGWYLNGEKWENDEAYINIKNPDFEGKILNTQMNTHLKKM